MISLAVTIERRTEDYTYLRYSDGVRLKWDQGMTVYVTVEQTYMKQVTGLCGTYTNRRNGLEIFSFSLHDDFSLSLSLDDLELPDGSLSTSVTNFGNEWRRDSGVRFTDLSILV